MSEKTKTAAPSAMPLQTRHVFLDTQVYRALHHSPTNKAMQILAEHVRTHKIVLHTSDITLMEIQRQIRENILAAQRDLKNISKRIGPWRASVGTALPYVPDELDVNTIGQGLYGALEKFLLIDCQVKIHKAMEIPAADIFEAYFERRAPFDGEDSKEFPDAFACEALAQWARDTENLVYVVTEDQAFQRAVAASGVLLSIQTMKELLARAGAEINNGDAIGEAALHGQQFDDTFVEKLSAEIELATFIYAGDYPDGEAYEGELKEINFVRGFTPVGMNEDFITLVVDVTIIVSVEIQFEDREHASYDREDDIWLGGENASAEIEDEVEIEVLIEVERGTGRVIEAKIMTPEIAVSEAGDWGK